MTKEAQIAEPLMELLEEHVYVANIWEDYWRVVNRGGSMTLEREVDQLRHIQTTYSLPLMEHCRDKGFTYAQLLDIIPVAFKTNKAQRQDIMYTLYAHAEQEHGAYT